MLELRKINVDNFDECINLKVSDDQRQFVAPNIYSLAQAYVFESALPFALYDNDIMVGFMMLGFDKENNSYDIWRLLIGEKYQGKGYGKQAVSLALDYIKQDDKCKEVFVSYVPENKCAEHIYIKAGFAPTGKIDHGEVVMVLKIK